MAIRATLTGFDPSRVTGVKYITAQELWHGSYATVLELEYRGLKCAGKKIHELLLRQGDTGYSVRRFNEEYQILSEVYATQILLLSNFWESVSAICTNTHFSHRVSPHQPYFLHSAIQ